MKSNKPFGILLEKWEEGGSAYGIIDLYGNCTRDFRRRVVLKSLIRAAVIFFAAAVITIFLTGR